MICYLDSSVIVRRILAHPLAHPDWGDWEDAAASALARVEARRSLDRLRLQGLLTEAELSSAAERLHELLNGIGRIPLSDAVLDRAGQPFSVMVKTLDAIHLASALLWSQEEARELAFLTHDTQQETAARALGLRVSLR